MEINNNNNMNNNMENKNWKWMGVAAVAAVAVVGGVALLIKGRKKAKKTQPQQLEEKK